MEDEMQKRRTGSTRWTGRPLDDNGKIVFTLQERVATTKVIENEFGEQKHVDAIEWQDVPRKDNP
jgi:hypothetical protein